MTPARIKMYALAFSTGLFGRAMGASDLIRSRLVVGTYIVAVPKDVPAGDGAVRAYLEDSRCVFSIPIVQRLFSDRVLVHDAQLHLRVLLEGQERVQAHHIHAL